MLNKDNFLKKYFPHDIEYPDPTKIMMKPGWLLSYIDSQFLSTWLNYLEILDSYLITRYRNYQANFESTNTFNKKLGPDFYRKNICLFGDDVLILAEEKPIDKNRESYYPDSENYFNEHHKLYWFFWFDQDSSDCCIGRFASNTDVETIKNEFKDYCFEGPTIDLGENREIHPKFREPINLNHLFKF